ncbi:YibE/F family protein [Oerskovia sp. Sa1BUA8]|uniref:YibE/F family protein n=1 Tax=Oerskovia douganii TaxID=2762210 RepID=A0A9D5U968_9CELL|nr:YibE/F family protein [Oerskovia douganii]MBE7699826.1 YibE/F family protein [Oerskovia douganii]
MSLPQHPTSSAPGERGSRTGTARHGARSSRTAGPPEHGARPGPPAGRRDADPHGHSHGGGPALPATRRVRLALAAILVPALLLTVVGLVALWPRAADLPDQIPFTAQGTHVVHGVVTGAAEVETGLVPVRLDDGTETEVVAPPEYVQHGFEAGDRLRMLYISQAEGDGGSPYAFLDFERSVPIAALAVAFALLVLAVARLRGLAALAGLAIALVTIAQFTLPALLAGQDVLPVALVTSSAVMFVVLYVAHGFTARTSTAMVGTLVGLVLTAALASWGASTARITGLTSEEALWLPSYAPGIDLQGIAICGIVLAGMGVLNDVTITQASTVWELRALAPWASRRELFARAMRIGRDHIASTVYTIAFAYVGAALPLLMAVWLSDQALGTSLTSGEIAEEVVRTLVGSIGLVLAIPLTTAVAVAAVPSGRALPVDQTGTGEPGPDRRAPLDGPTVHGPAAGPSRDAGSDAPEARRGSVHRDEDGDLVRSGPFT